MASKAAAAKAGSTSKPPAPSAAEYLLPVLTYGGHAAFLAYTWKTEFSGKANPISSGAFQLPLTTVVIGTIGYVLGCWALNRYMASRKPVNFKAWLRVYNVYLVALSAAMFYGLAEPLIKAGRVTWELGKVDTTVAGSQLAFWLYVNYNSKMLEFFDTVWILLSKRTEGYSFLHWQHHLVMPGIMWLTVSGFPGGTSAFAPMINSFIHTVMYTFYLLSSIGVRLPGPIKMSVTLMQMIQFVAIAFHAWYHSFTAPDVHWTKQLGVVEGVLMIDMLVLFGHFFVRTYCCKAKKAAGAKDE